jgi:hypothetical protein
MLTCGFNALGVQCYRFTDHASSLATYPSLLCSGYVDMSRLGTLLLLHEQQRNKSDLCNEIATVSTNVLNA